MTIPDNSFRVNRIAAPLRHGVTQSIRDAIASGRFKAGERLAERELCELVGVSRTLIREAVRQLEAEGLLTVEPHRGPSVVTLTLEQARAVYEVRAELEGLACRQFAEKATEDQQGALRQAFKQLKAAARRRSQQSRVFAKNEFYARLIEGAQNEALGSCLHILNSRITLLRATSMQAPGRMQKSLEELSELMDALLARDADRASSLARAHVSMAANAALEILARDETG